MPASIITSSDAAAFWGTAENKTSPLDLHLACALKALDYYAGGLDDDEEATGDPLEALTVAQAVDLFYAAAERLTETAVAAAVTPLDWQEATRLLHRLRQAGWMAGTVDAALVHHVYVTGEHGQHLVVDGVGPVSVTRARDRRDWDERGVARAVIDVKMEDRGGEAPTDPWDVVEWLLEVCHVDYARVTALRSLGLDPQAFCTDTPGRLQVQTPKPAR